MRLARRFAGIRRSLIAALVAAGLLGAMPAGRFGVEMPLAGDDGGRGIAATAAIRLALGSDRILVRDGANGGFQNPHRDEGSEGGADRAPRSIVAGFAADRTIAAAVGGLRRTVGDADAAAAAARGLPIVVLSRWSRGTLGGSAFCLCVSPPRLAEFARAGARAQFGSRLLLVLVGDAATLPARWPGRFAGLAHVSVRDAAAAAAARRTAAGADAVLVLADERPPALWRSSQFRQRFDTDYLRRLGHRDFEIVLNGTPPGDVLFVREVSPNGAALRAFVQRFHAAAGFVPGEEAMRAYAAAEILRRAGATRTSVRRSLARDRFDTVAGPVAFDADGYREPDTLALTPP